MITPIIHYCWFGKNEMPPLAAKCIASWKKHFPNWEIKLWNEENSPMHLEYLQTALKNRKWSNLSNYVRLHAIKEFGGIYFDTDIEVIKPFDFIDKHSCFVGFETANKGKDISINNAVIGAVKNHPFISALIQSILDKYDGTEQANLSSPVATTSLLVQMGLSENKEQDIDNVHVFGREAFYPYDWNDVFTYACVTANTYTIHYWDMSWKEADVEVKKLTVENKMLKNRVNELGEDLAKMNNGKFGIKTLLKINLKFIKNI